MKIRIEGNLALQEAINNPLEAVAMCGDARYVRLQANHFFDSGWIEISSGRRIAKQPDLKALIRLDFGAIREIVAGS